MKILMASSVIKDGVIVGTRLGSSGIWYRNIVLKNHDGFIYLPLIDGYLENMVMPGYNILLKSYNEHFEYLVSGTVTDISINSGGYVKVLVISADEKLNSRVYPRYDTHLAACIKYNWDDSSHFAIVCNIGTRGMAVKSKYQFDTGAEIECLIRLDQKNTLHVGGKIIRIHEVGSSNEYGMLFTDFEPEQEIVFSSYISRLEKEKAKLSVDYKDLIGKLPV